MKTITVANRKGGVGKTTMATHLAAGLAMCGYRVALVDTDSQGHCASALNMPKEDGLYNIMVEPGTTFAQVLRQVPESAYVPDGWDSGPLYLLPGSKMTAMIPIKQSSPLRFRRMLRELHDLLDLDYVIADTGPTNSMFDGSIMMATDYMLYVTQLNALSFDGLNSAATELRMISDDASEFRDTPIEIMGVVPNLMRAGTSNHRENLTELAAKFAAPIYRPIVMRTVWEQAFEYGQLVYRFAPAGTETMDAWYLVEQVLKSLGEIEQGENFAAEIMGVKHAS